MMPLIGVTDDYRACRDTILQLRPVIETSPNLAVPTVDEWTVEDLRPISLRESEYITSLPAAREAPAGTWVWAAGVDFVAALREIPELDAITEAIEYTWHDLNGVCFYTSGPLSELKAFATEIYAIAKRALLAELYAEHQDAEVLRSAYRVIDNIHYVSATDQALLRGLYLWQAHDEDRFAILRDTVVSDGTWADGAAFEEAVIARAEWHAQSRPQPDRQEPAEPAERSKAGGLSSRVGFADADDSTLQGVLRMLAERE